MYQTVIIELLTYDYETGNTNGLGALIRLIPGPTGYSELITATLSIQLAFESVLIQGPRLENENVERNYNILRNILVLLKYVFSITCINHLNPRYMRWTFL